VYRTLYDESTLHEVAQRTGYDWKAVAVALRDLERAGLIVWRPYEGTVLWRREI